ncbi:hypothetical protein [Fibrella aquatilis]|uniref:DUF2147 domain-containing protein n=1 Tax=Fibrella aquatilis TaxID=2817059 RepID=A0A939JZU1_9BACT|nr:hypothetical protein [Fibrella aquatilis]MBO0933504.1 hypothetical protein [Fibrella aquatilis]
MKAPRQPSRLIVSLTIALCLSTLAAFSQNALIGKWADRDHKDKQVEIVLLNGKLVGRDHNGKLVFKDLVFDTKTNLYNGVLLNPDKEGETFKISISLLSVTEFTFKVKKYFFSKSFTFIRAN